MKNMYFLFAFALLIGSFSLTAQTPYAHYPLDGNANDVSGNNRNGTITGNPTATTNRDNLVGKALDFNGNGDYIDLPEDFDFPSRTVIVWFNISAVASGNGSVIYSSDHNSLQHGSTYFQVYNPSGTNTLRMGSSTHNYNASVNLNTWYQAAIVRSPSAFKVYVNGALVYTQPNPTSLSSINGVSYATVGTDRTYGAFAEGKIDDLVIYNTALSDSQITGNYTSLKDLHQIDDKLTVFTEGGKIYTRFAAGIETDGEILTVTLTDLTGRVINQMQGAYSGILNENELPAGTYFVSVAVKDAPRPVTRKVVVAK